MSGLLVMEARPWLDAALRRVQGQTAIYSGSAVSGEATIRQRGDRKCGRFRCDPACSRQVKRAGGVRCASP
jgi:hypothetical protein